MNTPKLLKLALCALLLCAACATGGVGEDSGGEDIVGKPPARTEDPFSVTALPPPEALAPVKGSIDEPPAPEPTKPPAEPTKPSPEPTRPPAEVAARVEPAKPTKPVEPAPLPDGQRQCFSCIRICPISDLSPDCSESREDMICGWGAGDEEAARSLARAECNAALDMAREMPRWSSIDGTCPVATCR